VKGQDGLRAAIGQPSATEVRRNGRKLGGLKVWPVGSSFLKGETYGWLKLERPTAASGGGTGACGTCGGGGGGGGGGGAAAAH
jgi:phage terminase large subunit GpA-like protein